MGEETCSEHFEEFNTQVSYIRVVFFQRVQSGEFVWLVFCN